MSSKDAPWKIFVTKDALKETYFFAETRSETLFKKLNLEIFFSSL